ncbi:Cysteine-rich protein 2 [Oryzias melastigma]|uniref:Cysteine-rich protein 1 n=1 Tax=Oryzias melastigma TaxID=30732 RepID=A0A834CDB7_ORYME|nr:Cysteine-rich protein 2 [Oryzias melastigma]
MVGYCPTCGKPVYFGEKKRSLGRDYHPLCLKCFRCKRQLTAGQHAEYDEKPYCSNCYMKLFGPRDHVTNAIPAGWLAHFHVEGGGRADAAETGAGRERGWGQDAAKATG